MLSLMEIEDLPKSADAVKLISTIRRRVREVEDTNVQAFLHARSRVPVERYPANLNVRTSFQMGNNPGSVIALGCTSDRQARTQIIHSVLDRHIVDCTGPYCVPASQYCDSIKNTEEDEEEKEDNKGSYYDPDSCERICLPDGVNSDDVIRSLGLEQIVPEGIMMGHVDEDSDSEPIRIIREMFETCSFPFFIARHAKLEPFGETVILTSALDG